MIDGTKPGSSPCSRAPGDQDFGVTDPDGNPAGRNGVAGLQGRRGERREPDRVQLPDGPTTAATRSGGTVVTARRDRADRLLGPVPHRDLYVLRQARTRLPGTASSRPTRRARPLGPHLREQLQRLGHVRGRLQAGLRHRRSTTPRCEYSALGYSGTNSGGAISSRTPSSTTTRTASTPTRRSAVTPRRPGRRLPERRDQPDHAHPLVLGVHAQQRARQQQPQRAGGGQRRQRAPRHRDDGVRAVATTPSSDNMFSNNGSVGHPLRAVPRRRHARRSARPARAGGVEVPGSAACYESSGQRAADNTFHNNGYFGNPSNSDFGQIVLTGGNPVNCFAGQHRSPTAARPPT